MAALNGERYATIDVGTNSVLLLVAEKTASGFAAVREEMEITRLGRGVDRARRLDPRSIEDTVQALAAFAAQARALGAARIACVATSAARDAENGAEFFERARREAGLDVEVIGGDEEAALSYEAAARDFARDPAHPELVEGPLVVIDIGGGSTELIYGASGAVQFARSLDIGSVRMTERFLPSDPPPAAELGALTDFLDRTLAALLEPPASARVVGMAGTITTLAAVKQQLVHYDGAKVHGSELTLDDLQSLVRRLALLTVDERRRVAGIPAKRADVILAGAMIAARTLLRLGAPALTVSDRGVRWGLMYRRFG